MLKQWGCDQVQGFYRGTETDEAEGDQSSLDHPLVA